MFRSYRIGSLFGFPIDVNLSFLLMLGVVLIWWGGLAGVFFVLVGFASVVLHELGHALTARRLGVPVAGIELHFFGGAAKMVGQPRSANDEVLIAAAGPAVSFALSGLGFLVHSLAGGMFGGVAFFESFFEIFGWLNLIIGAFNLTPALPMDGGRILRALLTRKYEFVRATEVAVRVARGFALMLGLYGLFSLQIYLCLLAVVLWLMSSAELRMARFMGHHYAYDRNGYRRQADDIEVLPRDYWDQPSPAGTRDPRDPLGGVQSFGWPRFGFRRPISMGGVSIRRRNGRLVIEIVDTPPPR